MNLTMSQDDHTLLKWYVQRVRPLLDPHNISNSLAKPVGDVNKPLQKLRNKYGISIPTLTRQRRVGSTTARKRCTDSETAIIFEANVSVTVHSCQVLPGGRQPELTCFGRSCWSRPNMKKRPRKWSALVHPILSYQYLLL